MHFQCETLSNSLISRKARSTANFLINRDVLFENDQAGFKPTTVDLSLLYQIFCYQIFWSNTLIFSPIASTLIWKILIFSPLQSNMIWNILVFSLTQSSIIWYFLWFSLTLSYILHIFSPFQSNIIWNILVFSRIRSNTIWNILIFSQFNLTLSEIFWHFLWFNLTWSEIIWYFLIAAILETMAAKYQQQLSSSKVTEKIATMKT